jgi:REP element-mobilizing transposase RayT
MVIAHHIILTGYGHWLPNDPRGSLSKSVSAGKLYPLGRIHHGRQARQPTRDELRAFRGRAQSCLEYEVLWFDGPRRDLIARAFGEVIESRGYTCFACAIMPNHAHLIIRRHRDKAETMIGELMKPSARALCETQGLPVSHPIWSGDRYKKFLDSAEAVESCVKYVEANPGKSGLPPQRHGFVRPYRGEWSGRRRS